jgi:hypothetical protein
MESCLLVTQSGHEPGRNPAVQWLSWRHVGVLSVGLEAQEQPTAPHFIATVSVLAYLESSARPFFCHQ